ncbi:methyl-accepting chemotaxis protein [Pararhizobium haloflavum]|uniref:methyl-accepting chemotaxis protein n=1 Tax=Pararhizobium haloflavum TaxID=2037914 RepID=UPI000C19BF07|nr:methyl-accepting chemotaxis protein [Pararhizobium haloflavum]
MVQAWSSHGTERSGGQDALPVDLCAGGEQQRLALSHTFCRSEITALIEAHQPRRWFARKTSSEPLASEIGARLEAMLANIEASLRHDEAAREARHERDLERRSLAVSQALERRLSPGLDALARGDFQTRLPDCDRRPEGERRLVDQINATLKSLEDVHARQAQAAQQMERGLDATMTRMAAAGEAACQAQAFIAPAKAELSLLEATFRQGSGAIADTAQKSARAADGAKAHVQSASAAKDTMGAIEASAETIGRLIGSVDEIAFQTNLLALNAGIEAARAGDAGRGFAVVAAEVRALAQRSADAAREIKAIVGATKQQVETGVERVRLMQAAIAEMGEEVVAINEALESAAADQQSGSTHVDRLMQQIGDIETAVGESGRHLGAAAGEADALHTVIVELSDTVRAFTIQRRARVASEGANHIRLVADRGASASAGRGGERSAQMHGWGAASHQGEAWDVLRSLGA